MGKAPNAFVLSFIAIGLVSVVLVTARPPKIDGDIENDLEALSREPQEESGKYNDFFREKLIENNQVFYWPSFNVVKNLGYLSGAAFDGNGSIFLLQRGSRAYDQETFNDNNEYRYIEQGPISEHTLLKFSPNYAVTDPTQIMGQNLFYLPHGLTVDHKANVWVTDVALHQVFKFNKDNMKTPSLVLGTAFEPGNDATHFCKPTDVKVLTNGDFFVADGYCNSRIIKYTKKGHFIKSWGFSKNKDLEVVSPYELLVPHQMTLFEERDEICVADRENMRIVCFKAGARNNSDSGIFVREFFTEDYGYPYGLASVTNDELAILVVKRGVTWGFKSKVIVVSLVSGELLDEINNVSEKGFGEGHAVAVCPNKKHLLVVSLSKVCPFDMFHSCSESVFGELEPRNVWLFHKRPQQF